ncbi:hypothetical protein PCL_00678 [Purpureocillium lilacinum]|uniref:Uncharacterized protein n=1 Tax=Purpureocillium lilacinum TaxID=33203 RepID=A0A2U3E5K3_PURLI|nr:hypothetical protein PCL_00678 [Purpureocillium lilacinum]
MGEMGATSVLLSPCDLAVVPHLSLHGAPRSLDGCDVGTGLDRRKLLERARRSQTSRGACTLAPGRGTSRWTWMEGRVTACVADACRRSRVSLWPPQRPTFKSVPGLDAVLDGEVAWSPMSHAHGIGSVAIAKSEVAFWRAYRQQQQQQQHRTHPRADDGTWRGVSSTELNAMRQRDGLVGITRDGRLAMSWQRGCHQTRPSHRVPVVGSEGDGEGHRHAVGKPKRSRQPVTGHRGGLWLWYLFPLNGALIAPSPVAALCSLLTSFFTSQLGIQPRLPDASTQAPSPASTGAPSSPTDRSPPNRGPRFGSFQEAQRAPIQRQATLRHLTGNHAALSGPLVRPETRRLVLLAQPGATPMEAQAMTMATVTPITTAGAPRRPSSQLTQGLEGSHDGPWLAGLARSTKLTTSLVVNHSPSGSPPSIPSPTNDPPCRRHAMAVDVRTARGQSMSECCLCFGGGLGLLSSQGQARLDPAT